jgi:hypothetical protein
MVSLWQKRIEEQFIHSSHFLCGLCSFIPQVAMHLFLEYKLLEEAQRCQARQFSFQMSALQSSILSQMTILHLIFCRFASQQLQHLLDFRQATTATPV